MAGTLGGKVDKTFSFDGQLGSFANTALFLPLRGTVDFWVNPAALVGIHGMFGTFGAAAGDDRFAIFAFGSSHSRPDRLVVNLGSGAVNDIDIPTPLTIGQWTHVAVTFDYASGRYTLFEDGNPSTTVTPSRSSPTQAIRFGIFNSDFGQNFPFTGFIDEVEVFNRVLDTNEIKAIFDAGSAGKCKALDFTDFTLKKAEVGFNTNAGVHDRFAVEGELTLGPGNDGLNLATDEVEVTVGTASVSIPAGSFMAVGPKFVFGGLLNGTSVEMTIKEIGFEVFTFKVKATAIDLTDTSNPPDITLRIGNDSGTANVRLEGNLKLP